MPSTRGECAINHYANSPADNSEISLANALSHQEKSRTAYWDGCDHFLDLRLHWRASISRHLLHILPGQKILEIGAGDGKFTRALNYATRGECEIVSVVFSQQYLEALEGSIKEENIKVLFLDSFPGSVTGKEFDCVIAQDMMVHENYNDFLSCFKSVLKKGGGVLLFGSNPWNPYCHLRRFIYCSLPMVTRRRNELLQLSRSQLVSVLLEKGFSKIYAMTYDFLYPPVPRFLLWPAKNLSIIIENCPGLRNLAGAVYVSARLGTNESAFDPTLDLCEHPALFDKVSVVIPCRNESMNIPLLIRDLMKYFDKYIYEIIIMDDNSKDKTAEVAEGLAKKDDRIRVIRRQPPNGVGRALREGLREAGGEYILTMDADFYNIIPEMRDLFDAVVMGADVVIGSRFSRESVVINYPFLKIVSNRIFHLLITIVLGKHCRDISNNLKLFRKAIAKELVIESDDFAANAETGLKPLLEGHKVVEVPISWENRTIGMGFSSFVIFKTGPYYAWVLLRLVLRRLSGKIPHLN